MVRSASSGVISAPESSRTSEQFESKPKLTTVRATSSASAGGLDPSTVLMRTWNRACCARSRSFGISGLSDFFETSLGIALSMLSCSP